jgi:hypothetical protein
MPFEKASSLSTVVTESTLGTNLIKEIFLIASKFACLSKKRAVCKWRTSLRKEGNYVILFSNYNQSGTYILLKIVFALHNLTLKDK